MAIPALPATQSTGGTGSAAWANSVRDVLKFLRDDERCPIQIARCTSNTTVTTSAADITGTSITFTTPRASMKVAIGAVFLVDYSGATGTDLTIDGRLLVDGAHVGNPARVVEEPATDATRTMYAQWVQTLTTAGSHTIKLQAIRSGGTSPTVTMIQDTTSIALLNWYSTT